MSRGPMDWISEQTFASSADLVAEVSGFISQQLQLAVMRQASASLLVSADTAFESLYERLQRVDLDWSKVSVSLTSEHLEAKAVSAEKLSNHSLIDDEPQSGGNLAERQGKIPFVPQARESLSREESFVHDKLLKGLASRAKFVSLHSWNSHEQFDSRLVLSGLEEVAFDRLAIIPKPYNLVLLAMSDEGGVASLSPFEEFTQQAITSMHACLISKRNAQHSSINLQLSFVELLNAQRLILILQGDRQWQLYQYLSEQLFSLDPLKYPVLGILAQKRVPVHVFWSQ